MTTPFVEYLASGLSVVPIRADGSKACSVPWSEFIKRRPTEDEASAWSERYEGIAVIGGEVSGNLEIIDIDEPTLVRPYLETLRSQDAGLYDKLCLVRTPRRNATGNAGCHVFFRCETPVGGNTKLAMSEAEPTIGTDGKPVLDPNTGEPRMAPRTLIETRGEGGYALTVGCSPKCHPTGNLYEHVHGPRLTDLSTLATAERDTLHAVARMFDRSIAETHTEPAIRGYERSRGDSPGDQFNERTSWPEILTPHGWQCVGEAAGIKRWRRPGKASGISATTGVLSKAGNELLTVFSTNAHPFEGNNSNGRPGVSYSKFAAYAILNHGSDYEAAAKALVQLGYGAPARKTEDAAKVLKMTAQDAEREYFAMMRRGETKLITLGLAALDAAIGGGVEHGEMIVVGGLPSHGKSVFSLQAARAAVEEHRHVVLVSHEMSAVTIAKRLLQSRVSYETAEWWSNLDQIEADSETYWAIAGKLFVLEQCRSIDRIEHEIDQITAEFKIGLIIIDHAQLTEAKGRSRYEMLTEASARFKQLAVKHQCPVIVPSQLSRAAAVGEAEAHHLKETGALEQDADVVILVRWPWKANPAECDDPKRYIFKIVKNRNRPIVRWEVNAVFNPSRQCITEAEQTTHSEFDAFGD